MKYNLYAVVLALTLLLSVPLANANTERLDLVEIQNAVNNGVVHIPPVVTYLLGNERVNVYLADPEPYTIAAVTQNGMIVEIYEGLVPNPGINVYTDTATIRSIQNGTISFNTARNTGRVRYESTAPVTIIQLILIESVSSLFGLFGA